MPRAQTFSRRASRDRCETARGTKPALPRRPPCCAERGGCWRAAWLCRAAPLAKSCARGKARPAATAPLLRGTWKGGWCGALRATAAKLRARQLPGLAATAPLLRGMGKDGWCGALRATAAKLRARQLPGLAAAVTPPARNGEGADLTLPSRDFFITKFEYTCSLYVL